MSRFRVLVILPLLASIFSPLITYAASPSLVISEIQTGSLSSTGQEFVELYNPTPNDVVVDGWLLQYKSATSAVSESSWSKRADLKGTVKSHGFFLISQKLYLVAADSELSTAGLSGAGGHVRLKDNKGAVIDLVGWGTTANAAEAGPAAAPAAGQSIERLPGRLNDTAGNATDTDDNSKDFILRQAAEPQSTVSPIETPGSISDAAPVDAPADDQPAPAAPTYAPIMISELLPDPAAPFSDAKDEYVELYNPTDAPVNLAGYTIRAGSNFHSFYNLPAKTIAPGAYLAIYSGESHVGLTNTGGAAQLLDPAGNILSQTGSYGAAPTGQSWSLIDGVWKWSLQTTPGVENVFVAPLIDLRQSSVTVPKSNITGLSKPKAAVLTQPKSTTKTSKTEAKPKAPKAKKSSQTALVASATTTHSATWLLISFAILSIGYAIYEFRHDLRNYYHIAQRYLKLRRTNRPIA